MTQCRSCETKNNKGDTYCSNCGEKLSFTLTKSTLKKQLQELGDYEFEQFISDLWEHQGWDSEVEQQSRDQGVDVRGTKSKPYPQKVLIQAKRYSDGTTVGGPDIQQYASLRQQEQNVDQVIVITTSSFTSSAVSLASRLNVKIIDGDDLVDLISECNADEIVERYISEPVDTSVESVEYSSKKQQSYTSSSEKSPSVDSRENYTEPGVIRQTYNSFKFVFNFFRRIIVWFLTPINSQRKHYGQPIPKSISLYVIGLGVILSLVYIFGAIHAAETDFDNNDIHPAIYIGHIGAIIAMIGLYFDLNMVAKYCDWKVKRRIYVALAFIPYLTPIVATIYYLKRKRKSDEAVRDSIPSVEASDSHMHDEDNNQVKNEPQKVHTESISQQNNK